MEEMKRMIYDMQKRIFVFLLYFVCTQNGTDTLTIEPRLIVLCLSWEDFLTGKNQMTC